MPGQIAHGFYQFTSVTSAHMEEIISKINELGQDAVAGANYYPGAAMQLKVRFGDRAHGIQHVILDPIELAALGNYMQKKPEYQKVSTLLSSAQNALSNAGVYAREKNKTFSLNG